MPPLIFISHCGPDTWLAKRIADGCEAAGAKTFLDEAHIAIGADFEKDILVALGKADELLVVATPWALDRPYIWLEIGAAWFRGIPIIVVLHGLEPKDIQARAPIPNAIKEGNLLVLNQIDAYFAQVSRAVAAPRGEPPTATPNA